MLERSDVTVSRVIYDDIEVSETSTASAQMLAPPFRQSRRARGANLDRSYLFTKSSSGEGRGRLRRGDGQCQHSFCDVAAQSASAASYQPDVRRCVHTVFLSAFVIVVNCLARAATFFRSRLNASQALGNEIMGFGVRTGFENKPDAPLAFTFRFLFVLPFRFIELTPRLMGIRLNIFTIETNTYRVSVWNCDICATSCGGEISTTDAPHSGFESLNPRSPPDPRLEEESVSNCLIAFHAE